jgi:hypothetical protein
VLPSRLEDRGGLDRVRRLALDEQGTHGLASRPHVPFGGAPTDLVETERHAAAPIALKALTIDPLTIVDDPDYLTTLNGELTLPKELKRRLKALLAGSIYGCLRTPEGSYSRRLLSRLGFDLAQTQNSLTSLVRFR